MTISLAAKVRTRLEWIYQNTLDLAAAEDDNQLSLLKSLTSGTSGGQVNRMWHDRRRLSQASGTDLLDLAGGLTDVFGNTLTFKEVKVLLIENKGVRSGSSYVQTAGQDILVGGAANAWAPFLDNDASAKVRLRSGGVLLWAAPEDGGRVVAGTSDILQVEWDGSAASGDDIDYDIVIMGVA